MARAPWLTAESRVVLFSAIGSLPLHLTAVVASTASAASGIGGVAPGVLAGAALIGLFASSSLRSFGVVGRLWRHWPAGWRTMVRHPVVTVALQIAILLALPLASGTLTLAGWFAVGWISGIYMFNGMVAAASGASKFLGFMARLSAAMVLAGVIAIAVQWLEPGEPYTRLCIAYALVILAAGLILRPDERILSAETPTVAEISSRRGEQLVALLGLLGFFLAALMFISNLGAFLDTGTDLGDRTAGSVGISKIAAGVILTFTVALWSRDSTARFVLTSAAVILSMALLDGAAGIAISLVILVAFEIALNIGGSAAMAEVARVGSPAVKRMIPTMGLAGVAAGPLAGALLLSLGSAAWVRWAAVLVMTISVLAILAVHRVAIRRRRRAAERATNARRGNNLAFAPVG